MPDIPVAGSGDDGYHPTMEERVSRVESDIRDIKTSMYDMRDTINRMAATLDATLPHLATKAEVADLRTEMVERFAEHRAETAQLRTEMIAGLAEKPSKTYMWGILAVLLTAYACGLAGLAIVK